MTHFVLSSFLFTALSATVSEAHENRIFSKLQHLHVPFKRDLHQDQLVEGGRKVCLDLGNCLRMFN